MSAYASAACRHLQDARLLFDNRRWDNVGYLAGYVGECAAKAVIELASIRVPLHVDRMSRNILTLAADISLAARRYPLDLDPHMDTLRTHWNPGIRYSRTGSISEITATSIFVAAESVFRRSVQGLVLDGYLERVPQ